MWIRMGNGSPSHKVAPDEDFSSLERPQLIDRARSLGLDFTGTGPHLRARLERYQEQYAQVNDAPCSLDIPSVPVDMDFVEVFTTITRAGGIWDWHSTKDENGKAVPPLWVASNDPDMESILARHFDCSKGIPDDLEETHYTTAGPPGVGVSTGEDD